MALSVIAAACGDDDDSAGGSATASDTGGAATAAPAPATTAAEATGSATGGSGDSLMNGEIPCNQQYAGKTIEIMSPARNSDTDQNVESDYINAYQPLMDCTGVEVTWSSTDQFETESNVRLEGGNPPDVIDYPQPASSRQRSRRPPVRCPTTSAPRSPPTSPPVGTGIPRSTARSTAFRPFECQVDRVVQPKAFADGKCAIPTTLEELKTLSDKIVADGKVPWCIGAESVRRHGWVLTDWMEDFMLPRGPGRVRPVGRSHHPVQRPEGRGCRRRRRCVREEPRLPRR
jgi:alpha-glucoside transport system substrate-binding protein